MIRSLLYLFLIFCFACSDRTPADKPKVVSDYLDTLRTVSPKMEGNWPEKDKTHPGAKKLLKEDWLFNDIDKNAPFGSDDGADTYAAFWLWRSTNPNGSPATFVVSHLKDWGYPAFDLNATDYSSLRNYIEGDRMGWRYLFGTDAAIIATAIGQLYLEGKIDADIKAMAKTAIERESKHEILQSWQEERPEREQKLKQLAAILKQVR